jgi:glucose-6-phosphate dehydrogenase assembly protein OpcA
MTTPTAPPLGGEEVPVALADVERELTRQRKSLHGAREAPVLRASMSNLVIFCYRNSLAEMVAAQLPAVVAVHPARVLLLLGETGVEGNDLTASVCVRAHRGSGSQLVCSEQVTLLARGPAVDRLPYAVRGLVVGDLPTNLWWAANQPPPMAGALLYELSEHAQQIVYDSLGWTEPARGVSATAAWLANFVPATGARPRRVVSDLNWRRLKFWRRLLGQALDPASAPGVLDSITDIILEHGPHAVIQAWELVSWLAARLGWRVRAGKVKPGVALDWQFEAPHGVIRVCIRRLPEGTPEVQHIRIGFTQKDEPGALDLVIEDERRLAVRVEEEGTAPRTVTVQPQPLAELVGRQLSDREYDTVFMESMAVARRLAESLLE